MITEKRLRQIVRGVLSEASRAELERRIATASGGVYKAGGGGRTGNAQQLRLTVNADTGDTAQNTANKEAAKKMSQADLTKLITTAGLEFTGEVVPKAAKGPDGKAFSGSFDAYKVKDPEDGAEHFVVFAGGVKTTKEQIAIDAMAQQVGELDAGKGIMFSPDPNSKIAELRRPRLVRAPENVTGTPKADTVMQGVAGPKDSVYMSLKAGDTPKDHQQWSGATKFNQHTSVRDFVKQIVGVSETEAGKVKLPRGKRAAIGFYKPLGDSPIETDLKIWSLYGTKALPVNEVNFSPEKIHLIVQKDRPDIVELSSSEASKLAAEFPEAYGQKIFTVQGAHKVSYPGIPVGGYAPYLHARYDSSSALQIGQFLDDDFMEQVGLSPAESVRGVRFLVYPKDKLPKTSQDISRYRAGAFGAVEEAQIRRIVRAMLLEISHK